MRESILEGEGGATGGTIPQCRGDRLAQEPGDPLRPVLSPGIVEIGFLLARRAQESFVQRTCFLRPRLGWAAIDVVHPIASFQIRYLLLIRSPYHRSSPSFVWKLDRFCLEIYRFAQMN